MRGSFSRNGNRSKFLRRSSKSWRSVETDLVFQILVLLPIKSLFRLSCACKTWFKLINCSAFAEAHLNLAENSLIYFSSKSQLSFPKPVSIDSKLDRQQFSIFPPNTSNTQERFLNLLAVCDSKVKIVDLNTTCSGNILASCDGLILVEMENKKGLVVVNPMTKKLIRYPLGTICPLSGKYESYGFMYCNCEGRYKIVHLFLDDSSYIGSEILSIGSNSWRAIEGPLNPAEGKFRQFSVSAIGALHWVTENCSYIMSMDIESEKFLKITLPSDYKAYDRVIELWGSLGFVSHSEAYVMDIWVCTGLKEGAAWSKQYNLMVDSLPNYLVPVIASRKAREIFFVSKGGRGGYVSYIFDCETEEFEKLENNTKLSGLCDGNYLPFANSLVSWEYATELP